MRTPESRDLGSPYLNEQFERDIVVLTEPLQDPYIKRRVVSDFFHEEQVRLQSILDKITDHTTT